MRFTERIKNKIISILHTKTKLPPAGSSCLYLQLDNKMGAKLYKDKKIRNGAHKNQIRFNKIKLSPNIGEKFEIPFLSYFDCRETDDSAEIEWDFFYGYLTQHAAKVDKKRDYKKISNFLKTMESMGYDIYDLENDWNIGKINKRIVCIDTDPVTLGVN